MTIFYKILWTVLWWQLLAVTCEAQLNPGYMGRKAFVEIGTTVGRSSAFNTASKSDLYQRPFALAASFNADINYTIGRSIVAKLGWSQINFDVGSRHELNEADRYLFKEYHEAVYRVHANDLHFGFDFHFKNRAGTIAPMGTYCGLGLRILGTQRQLLVGTPGMDAYKITTMQDPYTTIGIMMTLGYRTIITDRFLFSICFSSTVFPENYNSNYQIDRQSSEERDLSDYISLTKQSISARYGLGLSISFGVFLEP
ncbi:MAG: hypothetical protein ACRBFS_18630 [Aureispira sp.]